MFLFRRCLYFYAAVSTRARWCIGVPPTASFAQLILHSEKLIIEHVSRCTPLFLSTKVIGRRDPAEKILRIKFYNRQVPGFELNFWKPHQLNLITCFYKLNCLSRSPQVSNFLALGFSTTERIPSFPSPRRKIIPTSTGTSSGQSGSGI